MRNDVTTFGEIKKIGYKAKTIKDELRENLIRKIKNKETVFQGIHGYENTVIPELEESDFYLVIISIYWGFVDRRKHAWLD